MMTEGHKSSANELTREPSEHDATKDLMHVCVFTLSRQYFSNGAGEGRADDVFTCAYGIPPSQPAFSERDGDELKIPDTLQAIP
jgi:hypothetical protein